MNINKKSFVFKSLVILLFVLLLIIGVVLYILIPEQNRKTLVNDYQLSGQFQEEMKSINWFAKPQYDYQNIELIRNTELWIVNKDGKYGIIKKDNTIIQPLEFSEIEQCSLGHVTAKKDSAYYNVDNNGNLSGESMCGHGYGSAFWDIDNQKPFYSDDAHAEYVDSFTSETVVKGVKNVKPNEASNFDYDTDSSSKFGIVSGSKLITPLIYDKIYDMSEDLFAAIKDGKSGYLDNKGNVAIPFVFDETRSFSSGVAAVKVNDLWGFIKK